MKEDKFTYFGNNSFQELFPLKEDLDSLFNNNSFERYSPIFMADDSEYFSQNNFVFNLYEEKPEMNIKENLYNDSILNNIDLKEKENPKISGNSGKDEKKVELPKLSPKEESEESETIKEKKEKEDKIIYSTKNSSDKKAEFKIEKLLFTSEKNISNEFTKKDKNNGLPSYFRMDMAKKYYKTKISQFATSKLNKYIKKSNLPFKLKKNIHLPSSKLFTSKVTERINYNSLYYTLRKIFTIGKEKDKLQKDNFTNISKIDGYIQNLTDEQLSESILNIKNFLDMNYEDLIRMFYDSEEFLVFKNEKLTEFFDNGVLSQEGFKLSEGYGLIRLFKTLKKS